MRKDLMERFGQPNGVKSINNATEVFEPLNLNGMRLRANPKQLHSFIQALKPPRSRLQRIRPPPLSKISNRPPSLLGGPSFPTPSSPLLPLSSCHAAAESPITAYMRFLHGSVVDFAICCRSWLVARSAVELRASSSTSCR
ncbi:hypothetical protein Droror1_Dr00012616 [Drosera rotundifolia]